MPENITQVMVSEEEQFNSEQNIALMSELIGQFKSVGYEKVSPEEKAVLVKTLDALYADMENPVSKNAFLNLVNQMETPLPRTEKTDNLFSLHSHLQEMVKLSEVEGAEDFCKNVFNPAEKVNDNLEVTRLWSTMKPVSEAAAAEYMLSVNDVFDEILHSKGRINNTLKDLEQKYPISFQIVQGDEKDGKCEIIEGENGRRGVISLYEGAVKNAKMLRLIMAHELGHYIDAVQRPNGCGHLSEGEEHTADILGMEMAANAGYYPEVMAEYLKHKDNAFLQKRGGVINDFAVLYRTSDLNQRLREELPNTPAGRKMKAFVTEVNNFYNQWTAETARVDDVVAGMPDERKMDYCRLALSKYRNTEISEEDFAATLEEKTKAEYQYSNGAYSMEECRKKLIDGNVKGYLLSRVAALEINEAFNPNYDEDLNRGYCTTSIMNCLSRSDKRKELGVIFEADREQLAHPQTLFKHFLSMDGGKYAGHIYASEPKGGKDVHDIIAERKLKPGALVCLTIDAKDEVNLDGAHNHLMLYTGKDKNGAQCFMGFNNDNRDIKLNNAGVGYVCDTYSMMQDIIKERHQSYAHNRGQDIEPANVKDTPSKEVKTENHLAAIYASNQGR